MKQWDVGPDTLKINTKREKGKKLTVNMLKIKQENKEAQKLKN